MKSLCYSLSIILSVTSLCVISNVAVAEPEANTAIDCFMEGRRGGDNLFRDFGRDRYCYDYGADGWGFSENGYLACAIGVSGEGCIETVQQRADVRAGCWAQLTTDCINNAALKKAPVSVD